MQRLEVSGAVRPTYGSLKWKIEKENELWRTRQNDELEAIIKGENIVRFINPYRTNVENRVSS